MNRSIVDVLTIAKASVIPKKARQDCDLLQVVLSDGSQCELVGDLISGVKVQDFAGKTVRAAESLLAVF